MSLLELHTKVSSIPIQYYDLKPSQLTDDMKIDNLVKVLALVQTSDNKPVPGRESGSSEQSQIDVTIALPIPRKVEDEELTMVSTLKRRQSEQEVKNYQIDGSTGAVPSTI